MSNINKQADMALRHQIETCASDPLNNVRREAVSHVLTRVIGADGFTIVIVSSREGKTEGLALAGGTVNKAETLAELLRAVDGVARQFGATVEVKAENCTCEQCRTAAKHTTH